MVTARKFRELGIVSSDLPEVSVVSAEAPRQIAVPEMLEFEELRQLDQGALEGLVDEPPLVDAPVRHLRPRTGTTET